MNLENNNANALGNASVKASNQSQLKNLLYSEFLNEKKKKKDTYGLEVGTSGEE